MISIVAHDGNQIRVGSEVVFSDDDTGTVVDYKWDAPGGDELFGNMTLIVQGRKGYDFIIARPLGDDTFVCDDILTAH